MVCSTKYPSPERFLSSMGWLVTRMLCGFGLGLLATQDHQAT
jgi:hypothetical protein